MTLETVVGTIAATGTTACWLPQVIKTVRTRSANDFSWIYMAMLTSGVACWVVYGIMKQDMVVLGANAVTLVLVAIVFAVKVREAMR